jgi:soluble lytic murein transglycosylase
MKILPYSVPVTLARWFSVAGFLLLAPAGVPSTSVKPLADAVDAYEKEQFATVVSRLKSLKIAPLADYVAYQRGLARAALKEHEAAIRDFALVRAFRPVSPLMGAAAVAGAQSLTAAGQPQEAASLLHTTYAGLPQPDGDLALAAAYESAGDNARAAQFYQRVYYKYPAGKPAMAAASALLTLRTAMGTSYPPPTAQQSFERVNGLLALREFTSAANDLRELAGQLGGADRDLARVRLGVADYRSGSTAAAYRYLKSLDVGENEADAERLYYLAQCARRSGDDKEMLEHVKRLSRRHPDSEWRLKALISAGNQFLTANRQDRYEDLFKEAAEAFPETSQAAYAHWKVAWLNYLRRKGDAGDRLRAQLERFPSYNASAAAYFLARLAERSKKYDEAHAYYTKLVGRFPNYYYGVLARQRLRNSHVIAATPSLTVARYLDRLAVFQPESERATVPTAASKARIERARLLHRAGLDDWAGEELRFGARTDAQPVFMALELARIKPAVHEGLRAAKQVAPGYLSMDLDQAPADFWRRIFPLPYRTSLINSARRQGLDPFLVAGLVRQESEFNPRARSRANALGLTQVVPRTGRSLARRAGLRRFSTGMLYQADANLRIGTYYLRSQLDKWGGRLEHTLAAYNAGPSRAAEWISWAEFEEAAEFVETIPFTETREYVQAVLRNAELYRMIYRDGLGGTPQRVAASPAAKKPPVKTASKPAARKSPAKAAAKPPARQPAPSARRSTGGTSTSRSKTSPTGGS